MENINEGSWKNKSGRIANPGKTFFLRLASLAVQDVNKQRDGLGLSYPRKAMIMIGMALNTNGRWEVTQQLSTYFRSTKNSLTGSLPLSLMAATAEFQ